MKLSIRWVIIAGAIILVLGTHMIITPSSYIISEMVLSEHMKDILDNISDLTIEKTYKHLNMAKSLATNARIFLDTGVVSYDEDDDLESLEKYFYDQLQVNAGFSGIYAGKTDGSFFMVRRHNRYAPNGFLTKSIRYIGTTRKVELIWRDSQFNLVKRQFDASDSYDPRNQEWFKKTIDLKTTYWTDPHIVQTTNKTAITIAEPSLNSDGNVQEVIGVDIGLDELSDFLHNMRIGKSGKALIINSEGVIIAHDFNLLLSGNNTNLPKSLPKINEINDNEARRAYESINWENDSANNHELKQPAFSSFRCSGKKYLSIFAPFPSDNLPWLVGIWLPEDDYLGLIKLNRKVSIVATIIITFIASLFGLLVAKRIINPIETLAEEARAIERHDMSTDFKVDSMFRELQEAGDSIVSMKESLINYESRLNESKTLYRAIAKNANEAIIMMDQNYCVSFFNPAAERMFGYRENQVMGLDLHSLFSPRDNLDQLKKGLAAFSATGTGPYIDKTVNVTAVNSSGMDFAVEMSLSAIQIKGDWHAVAIIRDITERKKTEQLRRRLADDLHDGLGGSLTNIKLLAEMTGNLQNFETIQKNLDAIAGICEDCLIEIRNYMNVLDDLDPEWETLIAELKQYATKILEPHNIKVLVTSSIDPQAPAPTRLLYINLQKIAKEAVTNVLKHSNGDAMKISVHVEQNRLVCIFSDNGKVDGETKNKGRGLLSMTSRAVEMGGELEITWYSGVKIHLNVPFY